MSEEKKREREISRRHFIGNGAFAAATITLVPRHVLGGPGYVAPSDKLNVACIGLGGKGRSDSAAMASENVVALCDVDDKRAAEGSEQSPSPLSMFPKAKRYRDFRVMLEKEKSIEAVTISTPDHTHAVIAMMAIKMGVHVFVQKPLTHTLYEARALAEAARKYKVVTQMGNQGHAGEEGRIVNEWIWDGAIGDVREVHCWTNRPVWPQGIEAPEEIPSVPPTLDWNLWLGPAKWRPYHPAYVPFAWRGWWDFGTGAVGDMGAHILDHPYWALKLKYPKTIQASSTAVNDDSYPLASMITYEFPERGTMPPVTLTWYDGGLTPPRPEGIEQGRRMGDGGGGVLFVGDNGVLMCSTYGRNPRLVPETLMKEYTRPEKSIPRSPGIHQEWIEACKGNGKATTHFGYSAPLTETMLLGNVATRFQDNHMKLEYDGEKGEIINLAEANEFLHMEYREGWSL